MKAGYKKPTIEFEDFELNATIAAGCETIVSMGPGDASHRVCEEYDQSPWSRGKSSKAYTQPFYEESCTCYLSAAGSTLITS